MPKRKTCGGYGSKVGSSKSKWIKALKQLAHHYKTNKGQVVFTKPYTVGKSRKLKDK